NAANWSYISGGSGGAGAPSAGQSAVFDGNDRGNCNIDTNITISTLTISTSTKAGYNGTIDASTFTITVSSFTQNFGTFSADGSTITVGSGGITIASGTFNGKVSSVTVNGDWLQN